MTLGKSPGLPLSTTSSCETKLSVSSTKETLKLNTLIRICLRIFVGFSLVGFFWSFGFSYVCCNFVWFFVGFFGRLSFNICQFVKEDFRNCFSDQIYFYNCSYIVV